MPALPPSPQPSRHWSETTLTWLGALLCPTLLSFVLLAIHANDAVAGLAYLVLVILFTSLAPRTVSIVLSTASALLFDYYFLKPYRTLDISGYQAWLAMIAFIVAFVTVNRVAEHARRQTLSANQRREDVERLYDLNQDLMLHGDSANLLEEIPHMIQRNFALDQVFLYTRADSQLHPAGATLQPHLFDRLGSAAIHADPEIDPNFLEGYTSIQVHFGLDPIGILAWRPNHLSREVAASIAAQIAVLITRSEAIADSTRLEAARSADRLRSALIDSLTHELRTPLTSIRAAATTLTASPTLDPETSRELALVVDEESARLDQLIGEAIEIAEIESASIQIHPQPVHPVAFLEQAVQQSRPELGPRRVLVDADPPDTPVWFDPHILGRALRHLLENAARYTPETTTIQLISRHTPTHLEFVVADNGPGISPDDLPHIFDKFYRGKKHDTAKGGSSQPGAIQRGTGMGLAITRALLTAHGGEITVASTPGQGATFTVSLPLTEKNGEV